MYYFLYKLYYNNVYRISITVLSRAKLGLINIHLQYAFIRQLEVIDGVSPTIEQLSRYKSNIICIIIMRLASFVWLAWPRIDALAATALHLVVYSADALPGKVGNIKIGGNCQKFQSSWIVILILHYQIVISKRRDVVIFYYLQCNQYTCKILYSLVLLQNTLYILIYS